MLVYISILLLIYPNLVNHDLGYVYTDTLILSMSISYFAQYFFGLKYQLLVIADQRGYIHYGLNTLALILNNILGVILIINGYSIQFVKLCSSLCLLIRPVILCLYVKKHYQINSKIKYDGEPIKQKWNGIAQHVASTVLNSTDTIVLTLFSTLTNVSIYNVYFLVVNGLRNLVIALTSGMQSLIGNLLANKEMKKLNLIFDSYETIFHIFVSFLFGCCAALVVPFVQVYTTSVTDTNYTFPVFGCLLTLANMAQCIRMPYNNVVLAAGHYKQTQSSAWVEMLLNIFISIMAVMKHGLVGVALGTLIAMLYRTFYFVWYLSKNIMNRSVLYFLKHFILDSLCIGIIIEITNLLPFTNFTYLNWMFLAIKVAIIAVIICIGINIIFYKSSLKNAKYLLKKMDRSD